MSALVGVVVFPGSNCEHDVVEAIEGLGGKAELIWHGTRSVSHVDALVLPGGPDNIHQIADQFIPHHNAAELFPK